MGRANQSMSIAVLLTAAVVSSGTLRGQGAFANMEGAQTNPIRLSADGTRLFAVNTPGATLSVFDVSQASTPVLIAQIPVGLEPVSVNPRTNDEAWVVNQASDSISIVSVSKKIVTDTILVKDEPMDVVFAGLNQAYVSVSRANQIAVFDTQTHALITQLPVFGGNPRALAVSPDGSKVYAAFAISGNGTTVIPARYAPPQQPQPPNLPVPPQVGLIVAAKDPAWTSVVKFTMPDNDVVVIDAGPSPSVSRYYSGVGTINLGLALNPVNGDIFVANTDARNLIHFEPNVRGHWVNNRITRIQAATGQVTPFDLNPAIDYSILPNPAALATALAQPAGVVFDPSGTFMYVAAFGTDRIALVGTNGNVLSRIEVAPPSGAGANVDPRNKRGPRGLALYSLAQKLYALNRISNTISIVDTAARSVIGEIPVGFDPTLASIRTGRGFLYDAKLSGNGTGSCASCHVDGDNDHLAWDLGDPGGVMTTEILGGRTLQMHPMKGPMTTQTLRGLRNMSPYHWRGDRLTFAAFNPAFDRLMGGAQLSSSDMTAFTDFVESLLFQPNPFQNLDRSLPTSLLGGNPVNGQDAFINAALTTLPTGSATCNACHLANPGPGSNRFVVDVIPGAVDNVQPLKVPHLRNLHQKQSFKRQAAASIDGFGMDRDGHVSTLTDFFAGQAFSLYSQTQKTDMIGFMMSFDTGTAPAVGYSRTLTAASVGTPQAASDWTVIEGQAAAANADLMINGTINGQPRGLLYQPSTRTYLPDTAALAPLTRAQLQAKILAGDTLTIIGVYPGAGGPLLNARLRNGIH